MTIKKFRSIIWNHYHTHKKEYNFPWRRTRAPYKVLVSEVMLQQTQIPRVIPKYEQWIKEFPTIQSLANAPFPKVLAVWKGLGYNRRARFLKNAAEKITKDHLGKLPQNPHVLQTLPGVGHYTARAVSCFAHGACEPFIDTNIRRVYIHFFFADKKARANADWTRTDAKHNAIRDDQILALIKKCEPRKNKREWYLALMDYGREALGNTGRNPNRKSAAYRTQSPFKGSRRYVRAKILSFLIPESPKGLNAGEIKKALSKDPQSALYKKEIPSILRALEKEKLVEWRNEAWTIAA